MSPQRIKNYAIGYISSQLEQNPNWLDCITDSWIFDAENWFLDVLEKQYGMKIFEEDNGEYDEYTPEVDAIVRKFWHFVQKEKDKKYDEKYGERDAKYCLHRIGNDIKTLLEKYNSVKHHFKKFNAYTEAVTYQFEELEKCIQLLDDIENDRVESLKEKVNEKEV